jgi:hypothetical protein
MVEKDTLQKKTAKKDERVFSIREWTMFNTAECVLSDNSVANAPGIQAAEKNIICTKNPFNCFV